MSITQSIVIKLILKYIGGSKIKGNTSSVDIAGKKIIVKSLGGNLSSIVGDLTKLGSISNITNNLLKNPVSSSLLDSSNLLTNIQSEISNYLPTSLSVSINNSISSFTGEIEQYITHTNILSGLNTDYESLSENQLTMSDISSLGKTAIDSLGLSKEDVLKCVGSITNTSITDSINNSFNSNISGGLTDIVNLIKNTDQNDLTELTKLSDLFKKELYDKQQLLYNQRIKDLEEQANLKLKVDTLDLLDSNLPDSDNDVAMTLFDIVATDEFKEINNKLS